MGSAKDAKTTSSETPKKCVWCPREAKWIDEYDEGYCDKCRKEYEAEGEPMVRI